jgi:hypothetical protein
MLISKISKTFLKLQGYLGYYILYIVKWQEYFYFPSICEKGAAPLASGYTKHSFRFITHKKPLFASFSYDAHR